MSAPRQFVLSAQPYYRAAMALIDNHWQRAAQDGTPLVVKVTQKRATRTLEQSARMWAMLDEVAAQVEWHGQRLTAEEWKDCFTAALKRQKVVPGIDGGFVVLGTSTRSMTVAQMSELMELIAAFGAEHNVTFNEEMA